MPKQPIDEKMYADINAFKDKISVKLKYTSNDVEVPSGSELVEKLHGFFRGILEKNTDLASSMTLEPISHSRGTSPIKFTLSDELEGRLCEQSIALLIRQGKAVDFDVDKVLARGNSVPADAGQPIMKIDAAKMERAFDFALEMGDLVDTNQMSFIRFATFFYNQTLKENSNIREEAAAFLAENQYQSTNHDKNTQRIDRMVDVAESFIASEGMNLSL